MVRKTDGYAHAHMPEIKTTNLSSQITDDSQSKEKVI